MRTIHSQNLWHLSPAMLKVVLVLCLLGVFAGAAQAAKVTYLKIPAQIKKQGEARWKVLKMGEEVKTGDSIRTGMGARVEVTLNDKRVFRVGQATEIELPLLETRNQSVQARVNLLLGQVWGGLIKPLAQSRGDKFEVATSTAVLGVKGTQFNVEYDKLEQASTLSVLSGTVAAVPPEPVQEPVEIAGPREIAPPQEISEDEWMLLVERDQKVIIRPGEAPQVVPLTEADKAVEWIQFNLERDRTLAGE